MVGANHLLHMQWQQPNTFELKSWGVYLHFDENLPADYVVTAN
jgi:hypothetical protein